MDTNIFYSVKRLSDELLTHGFKTLRVMPGHEKEASRSDRALVNYLQILGNPHESPESYILRVIPKNTPWENEIRVSFIEGKDNSVRVNIKTPSEEILLGEDPDFKVLLSHVIHSIANTIQTTK